MIGQIREPDNMRFSRAVMPKLSVSVVLRLIYLPLEDIRKDFG